MELLSTLFYGLGRSFTSLFMFLLRANKQAIGFERSDPKDAGALVGQLTQSHVLIHSRKNRTYNNNKRNMRMKLRKEWKIYKRIENI